MWHGNSQEQIITFLVGPPYVSYHYTKNSEYSAIKLLAIILLNESTTSPYFSICMKI